jgi:hypothetical protein
MRVMWIMTGVVVVMLGMMMGFKMLTHPDWINGR